MKFLGRKQFRTCLSMLLIVTCLLTSFLFLDTLVYAETIRIGTVTASSLNLREQPGTGSARVTYLYQGDSGRILDEAPVTTSDGVTIWYKMYINGYTGWCSSKYILVSEKIVTSTANFEEYMTEQGFPESYKTQLRILHEKYPSWVFEAQHTNLTWKEVIDAENALGKNLVHSGAVTSWKSMQNGAYDWATSTWVVFDSGGWVAASREVIEHFMDPRNFLDETNIFQFLRQSYNVSEYTDAQVAEIKAGLTKMVANTFLTGMCDGRPYVDVIMEVAANKGVSPYVLASMMIQEMGVKGDSNSMSGTLPGYEGYYNYFNVAAYKTETLTAIQKGLAYAKGTGSYGRPWNTRYKSIAGGAEYYAEGYVKKGQDTMYLKKFNVQGSNLYGHQYMTNVQGASSEGKHMAKAYDAAARQAALVFKIPVYKDMPTAACEKPTGNNDPNYMLGSLSVAGYSLTPTFSMHEESYSLIVPNEVSNVTIAASALSATTTVTGAGLKSLNVGNNVFSIVARAQNGTSKTYTVTIVRQAAANPEPPSGNVPTPSVSTSNFKINGDSTITGVTLSIKVAEFKSKLLVQNGSVKLLTANGSEKTNSSVVCTGDQVKVYDNAGMIKYTYSLVLYGDTSGDGAVDGRDLLQVQKKILAVGKLSGVYSVAADTDKNGVVDGRDLLQVKKHILGIKNIAQ